MITEKQILIVRHVFDGETESSYKISADTSTYFNTEVLNESYKSNKEEFGNARDMALEFIIKHLKT